MIKRVFIIFLFTTFQIAFAQKLIIYVSSNGNDSNDGSKEKPFLTLNAAIEKIKSIATQKEKLNEVEILFREGKYYFSKSIYFDSLTFSNVKFKITIKPYKNEKVIFTGSKVITGFKKIDNKNILDRIQPELKDKIYYIDLKTQGVLDYGEITMRKNPGMELFFNNERMTLCRYPDEGWLKIAEVPQYGDTLYNEGLEREKRFGIPVGRHYGKIKYDIDRPEKWSTENEIYMHGYWTWDWSDSYQKIKSIDYNKKEITIAEPHHHYGYTRNQRYYFLNILEELNKPKEWYLDRKNGLLYFYPPNDINKGVAEVSILNSPFIILNSTNNITIEKILFEKTRSNAIVINGGENNLVAGCTFRLIGDVVIEINNGIKNGILSCDIYDICLGAIKLNAGDRKNLIPSGSFVKNCHIHDFSKWLATGYVGISIDGVNNILSNNLLHNSPFEAIYVKGNDHILEYNEIYNVCNETGDAGATHTGRDYTWRGNIYRYNYFHHLKGPGLHGVTAIYLDDFTSGYIIYGNICYKAGRGVLLGGGRDNIIENNIFLECYPSILIDARGLGWASNYFDGRYPYLFIKLDEMNYSKPPYVTKYPELKNIKEDNPAVPKNNRVLNNISFGGRWMEIYDYFAFDFKKEITIKNNLIADKEICKRLKEKPDGWDPYYLNLDNTSGYIIFKNGDKEMNTFFENDKIIDTDPGFINYNKLNFNLKKDSPAFKLGFKSLPLEKIGLFKDKYRTTLPEKQTKFDF